MNCSFLIWHFQAKKNVDAKPAEKLQKYQQSAFEIRKKQLGCKVILISVLIVCLRWRDETSNKPNWVRNIRREENKSDIDGNGEDSTVLRWKYNKESAIRTDTRRVTQKYLLKLQL